MTQGFEIRITGKVQGVGFRPFIWKLAHQFQLVGEVFNDGHGVLIRICQPKDKSITDRFIQKVEQKKPMLAEIFHIHKSTYYWKTTPPQTFNIVCSQTTQVNTQIVPDSATCPDCIHDLITPNSHYFNYPFTNCTHCGPRFSIVYALPYDRRNTVLKDFDLCPQCHSSYCDPNDRRYHAQPTACHRCGPNVWITDNRGQPINGSWLKIVVNALQQEKIIALRSVGGFHLVCDATNANAVAALRKRKHRQRKPFAVMVKNVETAQQFASITPQEKLLLQGPAAPITLVKKESGSLCEGVAPHLNHIGIMLPSNPLQHLIAHAIDTPLVMTSGNCTGLPPAINNHEALHSLKNVADVFVLHNRDIAQRCDDSVVKVDFRGQQQTIRRSRGMVPDALVLPDDFPDADGFFSYGGDLKSSVAFGKGRHVTVGPYLGDLTNIQAQEQYEKCIEHLTQVYQLIPTHHVADCHPDYFTHQLAENRANKSNQNLCLVQHHHAHVASCLIENGWKRKSGPVLALALDGLGWGCKDELWGAEIMIADYDHCQTIGGIPAISLIGGDKAAKQPWRSYLGHLLEFVPDIAETVFTVQFPNIPYQSLIRSQHLNCHRARSAGRLFDAVAASLDICPQKIEYEGEAANQLESLAEKACHLPLQPIEIPIKRQKLDLVPFWLSWHILNTNVEEKAYLFHLSLARALANLANEASEQYRLPYLALTGGVFHNSLLKKLIIERLNPEISVLEHHQYSCGDGGLSLGQLAIALSQSKNTFNEETS
ncbi:carbamoyltransferase HypF [Vibrio sonorensis]|uniref:carbamoyltransferase HypF n=1 Tax=Vibrio sonorensis TaxID=1004316 RepID=UPI0008D9DA59|nr:carbamoyltransferase HypF [Vibrio sonorensis]